MDIELGVKVKDRISGFSGVVTGIVDYISGCNQALVAPPVDEKGAFRDSQWFDIQRLEVVEGARVVLDNSKTPGFGPAAPVR